MAAGTGGLGGVLLLNRVEETLRSRPEAPRDAPPQAKTGAAQAVSLRALPPIVTNLAEPQSAWIRLEASVAFDGETGPESDLLVAKAAEDIVAFLRTLSLSQIEGASGFQFLRDDLIDRVRARSAGRIRELVIHTFVIE
jgi:flagellar FliL protein